MRVSGTVIADSSTVIDDGSVVVEGDQISAVGKKTTAERYPEHREVTADIVTPGLVGGYLHSVQSLGRGNRRELP